ncbi:hypothetical protein AAVH_11131 [Aphelenchoides avenae]|nr:hypothetical protein AAVH_11131 [Aphelenchus avenae]
MHQFFLPAKLSKELFSEAFQFFTRYEADDSRTTCRMFNEFAGQLCDVFGYKMRLSYLSVAKGTKKHAVSVMVRGTNGHETSFEDDEEEAMARLKGAVRVAFVRNCEVNASWLNERLCRLFVEACSETEFFNMFFVDRSDDSIREMINTMSIRNPVVFDALAVIVC